MTADISTDLSSWSTTAASNQPDYSDSVGPNNLADNLRALQAAIRLVYSTDTIASAATTDLSTKTAGAITVSGTTTITALGTVASGIVKTLIFSGILTFTHNATTLILPTGANITTAAGDVAIMLSAGSGNWRCVSYMRASGSPLGASALLSGLGAAAAAVTIANADYAVAWNWALTTAAKSGFKIGETSASTGGSGSQYLLDVQTLATSTAVPFRVKTRGDATADSILVSPQGDVTLSLPSAGGRTLTLTGGTGGSIDIGTASIYTDIMGLDVSLDAAGLLTLEANTSQTFTVNGASALRMLPAGVTVDSELIVGALTQMTVYDNSANATYRPTLTSGFGTGASIKGNDTSCQVVIGTSSSATMVLTFRTTFDQPPSVFVSSDQTGITFSCDSSTSAVTITASSALTSGKRLFVFAVGLVTG